MTTQSEKESNVKQLGHLPYGGCPNDAPVLSVEDFLRDFRCNLPFYHQSEKSQKYLAYSMQSPAKRVCMEKEEGESVVQLLPHGGSETARNSSDVSGVSF